MAAPKAQTLQQRFGFADKDLTTPKHDEIMVWLDANLESIACAFLPREWDSTHLKEMEAQATARIKIRIEYLENNQSLSDEIAMLKSWEGFEGLPKFPEPKIVTRTWEKPVISEGYKSQYIVGFVDLYVEAQNWTLGIRDFPPDQHWKHTSNLPVWTTYLDKSSPYRILFEVKSSIPSLGEVIRQIRMYQTYLWGTYVIVSPDDRFADALRAQGIEFYKCPGAVADIWDSVS